MAADLTALASNPVAIALGAAFVLGWLFLAGCARVNPPTLED